MIAPTFPTLEKGSAPYPTLPAESTPPYSQPPQVLRDQKPLKVAAYCRVSSDIQREKETIKTQIELTRKFCADRGYELVETYCDDGVTGTIHLQEREAANRLLADAKAGKFQAVVVYKSDRIGRDTLVCETAVRELYDRLHIDFFGVAESIDLSTPFGRAMFTFQNAIGRLERENTLQRSRDATVRLAADGVWLGGIVPFGFRVEGKGRQARLRVADEPLPEIEVSEADVIRFIYHLSGMDGLSCIQIAEILNDCGVPTTYVRDGREVIRNKRKEKTREEWRSARVLTMLKETTYKGTHRWGKRGDIKKRVHGESGNQNGITQTPGIIERAVPAIVDEEIWHAAQLTLERNRLCRPDIDKRPYLLRGVMKCAHCGLTYVGTVSQGKKASMATPEELAKFEVRNGLLLRKFYMCNGKNSMHKAYGQTKRRCESGHLRADDLEEKVWRDIESFLRSPDKVVEELRAQMHERFTAAGAVPLGTQLEKLQMQKAAMDEERAVLFRLFRRGGMKEADLDRQLAELVGEEEAMGLSISQLEREIEKVNDATAMLLAAKGLLEKLSKRLSAEGEAPWSVKRRLVEELVAHINVESSFDESALRGQGHSSSVGVTYTFEPRELGIKRTGKSPEVLPGLSLQRTYNFNSKTLANKAQLDEWVLGVLQENSKLTINGIVEAVMAKHGEVVSRAGVSRSRQRLGRNPDNHYARNARKKFPQVF